MIRLYILLVLIVAASKPVYAQIPNASFEQSDSLGNTLFWQTTQGNSERKSIEQFGALPFVASNGNFFLKLTTDTIGTFPQKAELQAVFALVETPKSFYVDYLFLTPSLANKGIVRLLFTKWNGLSRDTILYINDSIAPDASGNTIPIQWNKKSIDISSTNGADSVTILFSNEAEQTSSNTQILYLDNVQFKSWPIGLSENEALQFNYYPNPATDKLFIDSKYEVATITIINASGKQLLTQTITKNLNTIDIAFLPSGLYTLQFAAVKNGEALPAVYKKLIKLN